MPSSLTWNDKQWREIKKRLPEMAGLAVKIGVQGEKASAAHDSKGEATNVQIAAVHEFSGPADTPPGRPFIRPTYDNDPGKWKDELQTSCKKILAKKGSPRGELRMIGEKYRKETIDKMKAGIPPPLADSTIAARNRGLKEGGTKDVTPLIDTGTLMGSISVEVVKK